MASLPSCTQTLPTHRDREKIGNYLDVVKNFPAIDCFPPISVTQRVRILDHEGVFRQRAAVVIMASWL